MTVKYGRMFFSGVDALLPRKVARLPYDLAYRVIFESLKVNYASYRPAFWVRHSVALNEFVFGISDLDVTLWFDTAVPVSVRKQTLKHIDRWKNPFIFLGEVNSWQSQDAFEFKDNANGVELLRDPVLAEKLGSPELSENDVLVFVLRNFWIDRENLQTNPTSRERRWKCYFKLWSHVISEQPASWDAKGIVAWLINRLNKKFPSDEWAAVGQFLLDFQGDLAEFIWSPRPRLISVLFPQRTMWGEDKSGIKPGSLTAWEQDFMARQMSWEIWGILGQVPNYWVNGLQYQDHFNRLKEVALQIGQQKLARDFDRLAEILREGMSLETK